MEQEAQKDSLSTKHDLNTVNSRVEKMRQTFVRDKEKEASFQVPSKSVTNLLQSYIDKKRWCLSLFSQKNPVLHAQKLQRQVFNRTDEKGQINAHTLLQLLDQRLAAYGKTACDDFTHLLQQIKDQVDTAFNKPNLGVGG